MNKKFDSMMRTTIKRMMVTDRTPYIKQEIGQYDENDTKESDGD
jgi:hypothetical protein